MYNHDDAMKYIQEQWKLFFHLYSSYMSNDQLIEEYIRFRNVIYKHLTGKDFNPETQESKEKIYNN